VLIEHRHFPSTTPARSPCPTRSRRTAAPTSRSTPTCPRAQVSSNYRWSGNRPLAIIETDPFRKPTRTPTDGVDAYWSLIEQRGVSADHLPAEY
jgi:hypothetical protein